MEPANEKLKNDVGVIVARFQVARLTESHRDLIRSVASRHKRVIIVLGLSGIQATKENPLDFRARKKMIQATFPGEDFDIAFVKDRSSNLAWSADLDQVVQSLIGPMQSVTLYGGRDSFIKHYQGRYPTQELEGVNDSESGTLQRSELQKEHRDSEDWRVGAIWATAWRFPTVYTCVDVAIIDRTEGVKVLLGKKEGEDKWRFIGGFADVRSESFEQDARREAKEETGLDVGDLTYLGSFNIDDYRYRGEQDKIRTLFFAAEYTHGHAKAADDIAQVAWVKFSALNDSLFVDDHKQLFHRLLEHLNK